MSLITRFAPAPTGYLHLGHVANALLVWAERERGARVLLRIEDHDRERCRPEYEAALLDDLEWLGFVPDGPPVRQRNRDEIYRNAAEALRASGLLFGCVCSRRTLGADAGANRDTPYPGTCRSAAHPLADGVGWRVRLPDDEIRFEDRWCGPQVQRPSRQCGDLLIRDRLGNWTYQFAVTVDDHLQSVTDVIRGRDLLESTGRQILLARLLGRLTPPRFAHHPLLMKSSSQKLSKSDGDSGVRELRAAGWTPRQVLAEARRRLGMK
jgi:glutamyl-tRNA synthetase/glutamyl-Q tRNA(Asp) synthetase